IRLPAELERILQDMFPRVRERERFVADLIRRTLEGDTAMHDTQPETVGGTLHLFTDGGSRGNPGQAAIGCILEDPARGTTLREHYERIGIQTNNVAEYRALIEGLKIAQRYHPNRLICHLDSELIVRQLKGEYKVRMPTLLPFVEEIRELSTDFPAIEFRHIPRADNFRADALVNRALDEHPAPKFEPPSKGVGGRG
ncbi:MAG: ribonuclease HI family protein, partial [Candidatus Peribacteraceae bacterium]|nr:ribonuclease HI family protein [Candidatus Peribacteraceae bacterium]